MLDRKRITLDKLQNEKYADSEISTLRNDISDLKAIISSIEKSNEEEAQSNSNSFDLDISQIENWKNIQNDILAALSRICLDSETDIPVAKILDVRNKLKEAFAPTIKPLLEKYLTLNHPDFEEIIPILKEKYSDMMYSVILCSLCNLDYKLIGLLLDSKPERMASYRSKFKKDLKSNRLNLPESTINILTQLIDKK